ncbi:MAG: NupC/NupG family nucleoside CNT transporter [Gammaproteobacteria bacterium]
MIRPDLNLMMHDIVPKLQSALGLVVIFASAYLLSEKRSCARVRMALAAAAIQLGIALVFLKFPPLRQVFSVLNQSVLALQGATEAGTSFVFGYLGGAPLPFEERPPGVSFVLAFRALPLIIVISALTSLLMYWRILPIVVRGISALLEKPLGIGGAAALAAAANVFVGMVEAPLFIHPYLKRLSRSELFIVMCSGMATIAGTVMILYATFLAPVVPEAAGHLFTASLISVPGAIAIASLMVPETGTRSSAVWAPERGAKSAMDAITTGTQNGLRLLLSVVAMLIVLVALVHLVNAVLSLLPTVHGAPMSLQRAFGALMAPVTWLLGIPWDETAAAGSLLGTKTVLNELLAYIELSRLAPGELGERSRLIMTYALCGFANFGSLGILIGGMTAMVPERRDEIIALGMRSIVGGTLATLSAGSVVGIVL